MRKLAVAGLAAFLAVAAAVMTGAARAEVLTLYTREGLRRAIVQPAAATPAPTVLVLHGAAGTAIWTARHDGFGEAAAARGFAAVFPQARSLTWNDGRKGQRWRADDVAYLRQLVGELVDQRIAQPERIYIAGISNGGMMAFRMLCEASELFAGVGTVIANMPAAVGVDCRPRRPIPVVMVNGTADALIPYHGGRVGPLGTGGFVWGTEGTAAHLAWANGCASDPRSSSTSTETMSVTRLAWTGCRGGAGVTLYRVNGGRHQVYGRRPILPALSARGRQDISAAETILATFAGE